MRTADNNSFRMVIKLPRYCSASTMFVLSSVPSFDAVLRRQRFSLQSNVRLSKSNNMYIQTIMSCDLRFQAPLFILTNNSLYLR